MMVWMFVNWPLGALIIELFPIQIYNIMTLPSRKFALLVSSTGRVGLSISCPLLRLISASSSDFPDLGGLARPPEAREAR